MINIILIIFVIYIVFKLGGTCESYKSLGNLYLINYKNKNIYINTKIVLKEFNLNKVRIININNILNNTIPKNTDTSLVSIIVPVFNASKTIYDTIGSLINQTHRNIEIIVVDDNSTDDSLNKLKKIDDNRVKLYKNKKNYGTYKTINIGLKMSRGNYIILQGSDDYACINRVKVLYNKINNTNINMVWSLWFRGKKIHKSMEGNFMFKRHILDKLGFFDNTRFGGDTEFIHRYKMVYNQLKHVRYVNDVLHIASVRINSLTNSPQTYYSNVSNKSAQRQDYIESIRMYHKNIEKTKNYYMPFLHKKNIYIKIVSNKNKVLSDTLPVRNITDLYIDDIAYKIL